MVIMNVIGLFDTYIFYIVRRQFNGNSEYEWEQVWMMLEIRKVYVHDYI